MMNGKDLVKLVQVVGETVKELDKVTEAFKRRDERLKKREAAVKQREQAVASTVSKTTAAAQPKLSIETQIVQKSQRDQVVITNLLKGLALINEEAYEPNPNMVQLKFGRVDK